MIYVVGAGSPILNPIHDRGKTRHPTIVTQSWYFLIFPVADIPVNIGFPNKVIRAPIKLNRKNIVVKSGTIFNHKCNI